MREEGEGLKFLFLSAVLAGSLVVAGAVPAAADPPSEVSMTETFPDVDPCTGLVHEVTIDVTFFVHFHDAVTVARGERALSTSLGYSGRGTSSFVENGKVEMFRFSDVLGDASGNRIRASGVFVLDPRSDSVRIDTFELTCVGS